MLSLEPDDCFFGGEDAAFEALAFKFPAEDLAAGRFPDETRKVSNCATLSRAAASYIALSDC